MKAKIYCKTVAQGVHEFFMEMDGERYYLFEQDYRVSNKEYFKNGVPVDNLGDFTKAHSASVRHTLEKLPKYIKKVSNKYNLKPVSSKKPKINEDQFNWRNCDYYVA